MAKRKMATGIAAPLRELRKERRLTQKQLGEALNITEGGYRSYERGESSPDIEDLPVLAAAMGVTTEDLLRRLGILTAQQVELHVAQPLELAASTLAEIEVRVRRAIHDELATTRELNESKPAFGSPEYKRRQAMNMTARLARSFAELPEEEQEAVWAIVEERKRLREREERAQEPQTEKRD